MLCNNTKNQRKLLPIYSIQKSSIATKAYLIPRDILVISLNKNLTSFHRLKLKFSEKENKTQQIKYIESPVVALCLKNYN